MHTLHFRTECLCSAIYYRWIKAVVNALSAYHQRRPGESSFRECQQSAVHGISVLPCQFVCTYGGGGLDVSRIIPVCVCGCHINNPPHVRHSQRTLSTSLRVGRHEAQRTGAASTSRPLHRLPPSSSIPPATLFPPPSPSTQTTETPPHSQRATLSFASSASKATPTTQLSSHTPGTIR